MITGFPSKKSELELLEQIHVNPDQVLILQSSGAINDCTGFNHCLKSKYKDVTKEVDYDKEGNRGTCDKVQTLISSSKPKHGSRTIRFFPRIIILGAGGSGCRAQAMFLCDGFNLTFGLYQIQQLKMPY